MWRSGAARRGYGQMSKLGMLASKRTDFTLVCFGTAGWEGTMKEVIPTSASLLSPLPCPYIVLSLVNLTLPNMTHMLLEHV